jgi:alkanesulfonate monooxygenase SsuD/methylene tetrahydromethanopterin reductase-like flavin-dependent oxidoreductase (luciferase family)
MVRAMEFSSILLTTYVDAESSPGEDERILALAVEQAVEFGRSGVYPWTTEHHFRGAWQSSPLQFMTHVAAQVPEGIYVGFGVLSVPYHHPVRLVEDMNLLDQLTKGQAVFGLGSGFPSPYERPGMGVGEEHHVSGRAARESIEVMERLWAFETGDEPFEFDNGLYRGRVEKRVVPSAYRRQRPRIIRTASSEPATLAAAEKGWPIFMGTMGMDAASQWKTYREALAAAGHEQAVVEECLRWCTVDWLSVLVADTDEQAEAAAAEAKADRLAERERYFRKYQDGVLGPVDGDVLSSAAFRSGADMQHIIAGSPDTVAAEVQRLADLGINHLIVRFLGEWLGQTRGLLERSLQLFADEVAPRFSEIPSLTDPLAVEAGAVSS